MSVTRRVTPALVLSAALAPVMLLTANGAVPSAAAEPVTAVVSYVAALPAVDGVQVRSALPSVRAAVVSGRPADLARLAAAPGVRSVVPDRALQLTGSLDSGTAVYANARVGGRSGNTYAGAGVRVAVVDTGVSDSPALNRESGRLVDAVDTSGTDGTDSTGGALEDGFGHGTFMASLVAGGPMDGTEGRAVGVAPGATVLVVRVARPDGSTSLSKVLAGLDWVAGHRREVDVVSLSLGAERPGDDYGPDPLTDAVQAVQDAGVTVVVAAGNQAQGVSDPGFLPTTITVGAVSGRTGAVSQASGSDVVDGVRKPDVVASGVSVIGVLPTDSVAAQGNPQARLAEGLYRGSGTSQATAIASGAAALFLARFPRATPADVKASLKAAALPVDDPRAGAGLLRAAQSFVDGDEGSYGPAEPGDGPDVPDHPWAVNTWSVNTWSANSWSANSWSANSWSANSWSANSWSANSWSANSWSASTWSSAGWGEP